MINSKEILISNPCIIPFLNSSDFATEYDLSVGGIITPKYDFAIGGIAVTQSAYIIEVSGTGTGNRTSIVGYNHVILEVISSGGAGWGATSITSRRAGGGGGAYARTGTTTVITIATPGTSLIYYNIAAAGTDSWVRYNVNSAPTAVSDNGALAYRATNAAQSTAGVGGTAANSIGDTKYSGVNGTTGSSARGGGAGGDGGNASGATGGGTGTMKGGDGGTYSSGGTAGSAPGGGGSGSGTTGVNPAGAAGKVRMIFIN